MALSKSAAGTTTKAVFLYSSSAGSGGAVYTVPAGKVFKGFITASGNSSGNFNATFDGTTFQFKMGNYNDTVTWFLTLPPGTAVANSSSEYFTFSGELVDGS